MPRMNFDKVEEVGDYSPLPEGKYPVKVYECEEKQSQAGNETWNIKMEVVEGEFKGKRIFDNITWSDKAFPRTKLVLSRLGLPVKGEIDYQPDDLVDQTAIVEVEIEEFVSEDDVGNIKKKKRNKVTFAGYEKWSPGETVTQSGSSVNESDDSEDENPPF
jgi:hypothetical protein